MKRHLALVPTLNEVSSEITCGRAYHDHGGVAPGHAWGLLTIELVLVVLVDVLEVLDIGIGVVLADPVVTAFGRRSIALPILVHHYSFIGAARRLPPIVDVITRIAFRRSQLAFQETVERQASSTFQILLILGFSRFKPVICRFHYLFGRDPLDVFLLNIRFSLLFVEIHSSSSSPALTLTRWHW